MVSFTPVKINLGLYVTGKREDGYHNLETVFYPIPLYDAVEVVYSEDVPFRPRLHAYGLPIPGSDADNLIIRAWEFVRARFPDKVRPVTWYLLKKNPIGAGLGAGSANAVGALKLMNNLFELNLGVRHLEELALLLGSDCPFFVSQKPCVARGRGEEMVEINLDLSKYTAVVVKPPLHISTREAFSGIKPAAAPPSWWETLLRSSPRDWTGITNQFESGIFSQYPELLQVKEKLLDHGALYASMSGSGSAVYGIFNHHVEETFSERSGMHCWKGFLPL